MGLNEYIDQIDWENDRWPEEELCLSCIIGEHECIDIMLTMNGIQACGCTSQIHG